MHKKRMLFVLGAGSSHEVGLPTGDTLKAEIAKLIDIRFEHGFRQKSGDDQIMEALRRHAKNFEQPRDVNRYLEKAWQIKNALPQAISIDNYVDAHSGDEILELCAKLGIAKAILNAERRSAIYRDELSNPQLPPVDLAGTWFHKFFQLLTEGISKRDVAAIFDGISFISFNYDRCLEQFLPTALANYYKLSIEETQKLVEKLKIFHPYGTVGRLPSQLHNDNAVPFGADNVRDLLSITKELKTFTEQNEDVTAIQNIHALVRDADTIVFLGFAFHAQNIELLTPKEKCAASKVLGTALGISRSDLQIVTKQITDMLSVNSAEIQIELRRGFKCTDLLSQHWRSLSTSY